MLRLVDIDDGAAEARAEHLRPAELAGKRVARLARRRGQRGVTDQHDARPAEPVAGDVAREYAAVPLRGFRMQPRDASGPHVGVGHDQWGQTRLIHRVEAIIGAVW